ncbi:unnamed protein product [Brassicogethes aeneus]|uniref:Chitin-binding type-2 domain-containing protein n=1 Tax=Brassicogethes aeneus TaxID=1431903 RepID=A0A9P0F8T4_BRAAE|nr:unnamed protein product [Brassicogethes aeneus]
MMKVGVLILYLSVCNGLATDSFCPFPSDKITFFPFPGNCQKFYECLNGHAFEYNCPPNLYWNQKIVECDFLENVECEDGPVPASVPTTEVPDVPTPVVPTVAPPDETCVGFSPNEATLIPYPGDCSKYYECFAGKANIMPCPPGLFWDNPKKTCDFICVP